MDRQLLVGCLATWILIAGCSKSKSPPGPTAAAAPTQAAPTQAAPVQAAPQDEAAASQPASAAPGSSESAPPNLAQQPTAPPAPSSQSYAFRTESALPADTIEQALAAPPSDFTNPAPPAGAIDGLNPLRLDFTPNSAPGASGNPLRAARDLPRMSAPRDAFPAAPAAEVAAPSGGSAPLVEMLPGSAAPLAPITARALATGTATDVTSDGPFELVQVFYGTNRQSAEQAASDWPNLLLNFLPTGFSFLITACVGLAAATRRSFTLALVALGGLAASLGLGYQASAATLTALRRAGTAGPRYTTKRAAGGHVDVGLCEVTVPRTHQTGEVESPSITRLEIHADAASHIILQKTERLLDAHFYEMLQSRVAASERKELFVFVHGFNVSFEDAARRTAPIHHDLHFDGAPIFFSWPAHDKFIFTYPADEANVAWSVPHLKKFLLQIVKESQASSVNLIAHSMGNRAVTAALREIDLELRDQARLFNQVILAAPDIDADEFRTSIAPAMQRTAKQFTLYASSRDDALLASQLVHRGPRAGDAGEGLVVVSGIDTIDVTAIDSSPWGHSYYGSSDPVLNDLRTLFSSAVAPRERAWLSPAQRDGLTYWIFQPTRTAEAGGDLPR